MKNAIYFACKLKSKIVYVQPWKIYEYSNILLQFQKLVKNFLTTDFAVLNSLNFGEKYI